MSPLLNAANESCTSLMLCTSLMDSLRAHPTASCVSRNVYIKTAVVARNAAGIRYAWPMRLSDVVAASAAVASTAARLAKISHLSSLLQRVPPDELAIVIPFLSGETRQGRIGIGGALLSSLRDVPPASDASLELAEVDAAFERIASTAGAGSAALRVQILRQLLERATADEQDFLIRLLFGELRQGALEGVLTDAVAKASAVPASRIRRAAMLAGDLTPVARVAITEGDVGLSAFILQPFQ